MYQVIARKYRPQTFSELIGQEHVRTTLENAIAQRRIAHGYILSGQRGTGKTTVARILARCLNCVEGPTITPCGKCSSCLEVTAGGAVDVIEIDAASNRGINEMRELRENVRYRPARDRYKVFIIDEAHQITNEAFNALLKTLEEPPEWVVFVLCTTESHKIPTTIASRCQQFSFRSVEFGDLVTRMEWICAEEGIKTDAESLTVLAQAGEGSVRDSLSALDQAIACCGEMLTGKEVRALLGMFSLESLNEVTRALSEGNSQRMLEIVDELERTGQNLQHFCRELSRYFRNLLVARIAGQGTRLISASAPEQERLAGISAGFGEEDLTRYLQITLDLYREIQFSLQPRLHMEIGLLRLVHAAKLLPIEQALSMLQSGKATVPIASPAPVPARAPQAAKPQAAKPQTAPPPRVAPSPYSMDAARKTSSAPTAAAPPAPASGSLKERLHSWLSEQGMTFIADAVEHAEITENAAELVCKAPREFLMGLRSSEMQQAVAAVLGKPKKIRAEMGEGATQQLQAAAKQDADKAKERALENPEVQRFQELFPDSQIRTVRNLKE